MADFNNRLLSEAYAKKLKPEFEDGWLWCPIRVKDFSENNDFQGDGRRLSKIIKYCYAPGLLHDRNFSKTDVKKWSLLLLEYSSNRWLKEKLETIVKNTYEPYLKEWPVHESKGSYTIKKGDTLSRIASAYSISWQKLYEYSGETGKTNRERLNEQKTVKQRPTKSIDNPDLIYPDDVILVPNKAKKTKNNPDEETDDSGLNPGEVLALCVFHSDQNMDNLIASLIAQGTLKTSSEWDNNYIYFKSIQVSDLGLEDKKKFVVEHSEYKWFLWMDVGAWSQHTAIVGIVTADEVAMFDIYANSTAFGKSRQPTEGSLVDQIVKSLWQKFLQGGTIFYQDLKEKNFVSTPILNNEIIFVIPDLHLHLFKGYIADNFTQPANFTEEAGRPLDEIFEGVLQVISAFRSKATVKTIQVGDMYELWESAMLLGIGLNPDMESIENTILELATIFQAATSSPDMFVPQAIDNYKALFRTNILNYIKSIETEAKKRNLDTVFSQTDLDNLRLRWTDFQLKTTWKKMQQEIEKQHITLFDNTLYDSGIFGKFSVDCQQTIVGGNHDSFLDFIDYKEEGINNHIRFEHLHYNDPYNKPSAMEAGQFMTILNVVAETMGVGDQAKALEGSRREDFKNDVGRINHQRYLDGKSMYDIIITGHTHRAYAQFLGIKLTDGDDFFLKEEPSEYDQGWPGGVWENLSSLPMIVESAGIEACAGMAALGGTAARGFAKVKALKSSNNKDKILSKRLYPCTKPGCTGHPDPDQTCDRNVFVRFGPTGGGYHPIQYNSWTEMQKQASKKRQNK